MEKLPEDLLPIIFSYVQPIYKYNLNKKLFSELFVIVNSNKIYGNHSYLRNIIRNDLSYIFNEICSLKWMSWQSLKNWRYKSWKFADFTQYVLYLINFHQANKCKNEFLKYHKKDTKKKNKTKKTFWSN